MDYSFHRRPSRFHTWTLQMRKIGGLISPSRCGRGTSTREDVERLSTDCVKRFHVEEVVERMSVAFLLCIFGWLNLWLPTLRDCICTGISDNESSYPLLGSTQFHYEWFRV